MPLTMRKRVDPKTPAPPSKQPLNGREGIFVRRVSGKELKAFRQAHGISARGLAQLLHYSRTYVKRIEGNSLGASAKFTEAFYAVRAEWENIPPPTPKPLTVISPGPIAEGVSVLVLQVRPHRCQAPGCHNAFVPHDRRQKFCSDACRRRALAKANKQK